MQIPIYFKKTIIDGNVFGDRFVSNRLQRGHALLCCLEISMSSCLLSCENGRRNRRPERACLTGTGYLHGAPGHIGVNLHQKRIFFGNTAAADNSLDSDTILPDPFDDHASTEGSCLNKSPVNLRAGSVNGLTQDQPDQSSVDKDRPVPVVPVERNQAAFAR